MKVEIDTNNKTIKVLEECKIMDLLNTFRDLDNYREYKIIPNTIINTIKIKDSKPLEWVQPYTQPWTNPYYPFPQNPFKITCDSINEAIKLLNNK